MKKAAKKTIGRFSGLVIGMGICYSFFSDCTGLLVVVVIGCAIYLITAHKAEAGKHERS